MIEKGKKSRSMHVKLSIIARTFEIMTSLCDVQCVQNNEILKSIADRMRSKLKQCKYLIKFTFVELDKALELGIRSGVIVDGNLLRSHVPAITENLKGKRDTRRIATI